jgi:hypothetical protein
MADRNVYVDTLILTPTLKIYIFFGIPDGKMD